MNKCRNIFCERNDQIHSSGCRIPDYAPENCILNKRYIKEFSMNFGEALDSLVMGNSVSRRGWNGERMFLSLQMGTTIDSANARGGVAKALSNIRESDIEIHSHIDMCLSDGTVLVGWTPSQIDMLSSDWELFY